MAKTECHLVSCLREPTSSASPRPSRASLPAPLPIVPLACLAHFHPSIRRRECDWPTPDRCRRLCQRRAKGHNVRAMRDACRCQLHQELPAKIRSAALKIGAGRWRSWQLTRARQSPIVCGYNMSIELFDVERRIVNLKRLPLLDGSCCTN